MLKPAHAYGGRSVFLGSETSPDEWEGAVQAALGAPWVVQERVSNSRGGFSPCWIAMAVILRSSP